MSEIVKTIRLSATLRTVAGAKEVQVRVDPSGTVRDLLQTCGRTIPRWRRTPQRGGGLNDGIS
jgi:hypothetical protein